LPAFQGNYPTAVYLFLKICGFPDKWNPAKLMAKSVNLSTCELVAAAAAFVLDIFVALAGFAAPSSPAPSYQQVQQQ